MKPVILWDAKRVPLRDKSGNPIKDEYTGAFSTKVSSSTPGAFNYTGSNAAGIEWNFWAKEVTAVRGFLRWIDKRAGKYGTTIVMFLESDRALHQVSIGYDIMNLRQIVNCLCGLQTEIADTYLNVGYWVRKDKDANGVVKVTENGKARWAASMTFQDVSPIIPFKEFREYAQQNNLAWEQKSKPNGDKWWDQSEEFKYWDSRLVKIQKFLLNTPGVLPFTYESLSACEAANPSGGGNLSKEEIETCADIYERVKPNYKFPYSRVDVDADSILDEYMPPAPAVREVEYQDAQVTVPAITEPVASDTFSDDDLPF